MAKQHAPGIIIFMPIIENQSYLDTLDDEVGQAVKRIDYSVNQTQHRKNKQAIVDALQKGEFEVFGFRKERMNLGHVNESVLIKIGPKKRGHLAAFRGSWVRLVWLSTYGGYTMNCAVQKLVLTDSIERTLIPCGPYTKEEWDDVSARYPFAHTIVDGERMMKLRDGSWIKSTPTDAAFKGKEKDNIPDGTDAFLVGVGPFIKHGGRWVRILISSTEYEEGACLELPIGTQIYVGDIKRGFPLTKFRTADGWSDKK